MFKWNAIQLTVTPLKGTLLYANVSILLWTPLAVPKPRILIPKRYDEHPRPFYIGVPPGVIPKWSIAIALVTISIAVIFTAVVLLYRYCIVIVLLLYCYCIVIVLLLYCYCIVIALLLYCYCIVIVLLLYCYCIVIVIVIVLLLYCYCIVIVSVVVNCYFHCWILGTKLYSAGAERSESVSEPEKMFFMAQNMDSIFELVIEYRLKSCLPIRCKSSENGSLCILQIVECTTRICWKETASYLTPEQQEELSIGRGSLTTALRPGGIVPYSIDDSISKYMAIYISIDSSIHRRNPTVVRHRCAQRCDSSGSDSAEITMYT